MSSNLPIIALAGKKNVGKSSLLNSLVGKSRAITDDYAGLTRDLLQVEVHRYGYHFRLVDMPGLDLDENEPLEKAIMLRSRSFLETVDCIVIVYESPLPTPFDLELRELLRRHFSKIPVIEIVNKVDNADESATILTDFYEVGLSPIPVSAKSRYNLSLLCQTIDDALGGALKEKSKPQKTTLKTTSKADGDAATRVQGYTKDGGDDQAVESNTKIDSTIVSSHDEEDIRIALVGKPNVGKSSLFNRWIGKDMSLVSDIPGTTRDTIDTVFQYFGRKLRVIDTAGLRRSTKIKEAPEFFSSRRTRRAIQDSHVVVQLLSAADGVTDYDKKIAALVQELSRPSIIIINKWDLIPDKETNTQKEFLKNVQALFPYLKKIPIYFSSALTGKRTNEPLAKAVEVFDKASFRVPTSKLNDLVRSWLKGGHGIPVGFKILYATQTGRMPPVFVIFANKPELLPKNAISFLENRMREEFNLEGIPIRILLRSNTEPKTKSNVSR